LNGHEKNNSAIIMNKRMRLSLTLVSLALFACIVLLSGSASTQPLPDEGNTDYIIGAKDELLVAVWAGGHLEHEATVLVSHEGTIPVYLVGDVEVAGLTVEQARRSVIRLLSDGYFKNPSVIIKVNEFNSKEVIVAGAVEQPGIFVLETNTSSVLKLMSRAGGPSDKRGNKAHVYRGGAEKLAIGAGGPAANEQDGEKGKNEKFSRLPRLLRGTNMIEVNLTRLLDQGDASYDLVIYPGDYIYVLPKTSGETAEYYVYVEGRVENPKRMDWQPGLTAYQAVIECGGFTDVAAPNRSYLTRMGDDGTPERRRIRLKDIQRGKKSDVELQPGDRILVGESWF